MQNKIEKKLREKLEIIKTLVTLPEKGYLAGGCFISLLWEEISGKDTKLNDIDIFYYKKPKKYGVFDDDRKVLKQVDSVEKEKDLYYDHIVLTTKDEYLYSIVSVENDGLINVIEYNAKDDRIETLISRFDLSYTQVGYDIENDRFFWTSYFERFLETKMIEVTALPTPIKTYVRLHKKSQELDIEVSEVEKNILIMSSSGIEKLAENNVLKMQQYIHNYKQIFNVIDKTKYKKNTVFNVSFINKNHSYNISAKSCFNYRKLHNYFSIKEYINVVEIIEYDFDFAMQNISYLQEMSKTLNDLNTLWKINNKLTICDRVFFTPRFDDISPSDILREYIEFRKTREPMFIIIFWNIEKYKDYKYIPSKLSNMELFNYI